MGLGRSVKTQLNFYAIEAVMVLLLGNCLLKVFTSCMVYVMCINRSLKEAPIAEIKVNTSHFTEATQAIRLRDPLFDLVIANIS